jgi:hypothetical protein
VKAHLLLAALALASCAPRATAVVRPARDGTVSFEWNGPADEVFLTGTMTGWRRVPLARRGGRFSTTLAVPPGRHEYRLEVHVGGTLTVVLPRGAERAEDGYGGENAVLRAGGR